jgi:hypothetical protein
MLPGVARHSKSGASRPSSTSSRAYTLAAVLSAHEAVGLSVLVTAAVATIWGGTAYVRRREPRRVLGHVIALVQTLLVAQVGLGLLLLSDERRATDDLHYAYGTLALLAVLVPWMYAPSDPRRRLAWFTGATLLGGALATRAYLTSG